LIRPFIQRIHEVSKSTEALEKTVIAGSQEQPLEDGVTVYMFQWKNIIKNELPQAG
jgi:protein involved in polysaccharide export with SLBB domain